MMLIEFVWFIVYGIVVYLFVKVIEWIGYKKLFVVGFLIMVVGVFGMIVVVSLLFYGVMFVMLFVIVIGVMLL